MKKLSLNELKAQKAGQVKGNLEAINGGCCWWLLALCYAKPAQTPAAPAAPAVQAVPFRP